MCDGPMKTVKYIWVNILDACLIGFCHKTAEIHFAYNRSTSKECKNQLLAANVNPVVAYQMEGYRNSGFVVILHYLNSFQHSNYLAFSLLYVLLRENHMINAVFPHFIMTAIPHVKCDVGSGRENAINEKHSNVYSNV